MEGPFTCCQEVSRRQLIKEGRWKRSIDGRSAHLQPGRQLREGQLLLVGRRWRDAASARWSARASTSPAPGRRWHSGRPARFPATLSDASGPQPRILARAPRDGSRRKATTLAHPEAPLEATGMSPGLRGRKRRGGGRGVGRRRVAREGRPGCPQASRFEAVEGALRDHVPIGPCLERLHKRLKSLAAATTLRPGPPKPEPET
jgi:hypothetical protein